MRLIVGTNTYVTINEADKIVEDYFVSDDELRIAYDNLDDENKSVILYKSCIDMQRIMYRGHKKDSAQELAFPRVTRAGHESDSSLVKLAQVLNALSYMGSDTNQLTGRVNELKRNGVRAFSLGSFNISLDKSSGTFAKSYSGMVEQLLPSWVAGGVKIV